VTRAPHDLYRNLHTGSWSRIDRITGLVDAHPVAAAVRDARLVVQPAGRARVRAERRKTVHAYVRGTVAPAPDADGWQRLTYNPYVHDTFVLADGPRAGTPVLRAAWVALRPDGTAWALDPHASDPTS
jgi:hypothetical protein